MNTQRIALAIILFLIPVSSLNSERSKLDSLHNRLERQKDSARISTLLDLSWGYRNFRPDSALKFGLEAIELSKQFNDFENLAKAHSFVGVAFRIMGDYLNSIDYYYNGLDIAKEHNIEEQEGYAFLNIANLFIYQDYHRYAIENIKRSEDIALRINNSNMLSYVYLYYGRAYMAIPDLEKAMDYFHKALVIRKELNLYSEQAVCYKYIGDVYHNLDNLSTALENYELSLGTVDKNADKDLFAEVLMKQSMVYLQQNKIEEALKLAERSMEIAKDVGANLTIRNSSQVLAKIALMQNKHKNASAYFQNIIELNEKLFGQQLTERIFFLEYQIEKQQKENKIEMLNKDNLIKELELNRAKSFNFTLLLIVVLLSGMFLFALFTLKERRKQTRLLEQQNQEITNQRLSIEQKTNNLQNAYSVIEGYVGKITDSIQYAKKIQEAILPNIKSSTPFFSDSFTFYLPKDFVSGDFYWLNIKNNVMHLAVADCTGHGVPGAFMSIIGMDLLSQAVNQQNITDPAQILDFLNVELRKKLHKEIEEELILKDSMDVAVVRIEAETSKLVFSGALIPLTIVRDGKIIEHKPQFTSIGISSKVFNRPFNQEHIELKPGDWIYLYSDGFMDQFGGKNKKKYMRSAFFKTLLCISTKGGNEQAIELRKSFFNWKGNNEQIDDVLVLGLKV
jgi:serine phosphatase RsbU (regulator of sigma subunit)